MALETHVTDRYGAEYIVNLTNPFLPGATAIDAGRLTEAADDVKAEFEIYVGVVYDDTNALHIATAVPCVVDKLIMYTGQGDTRQLEEKCIERMKALARVTARDRIMPTTNSQLTQSKEQVGTEIVRPDFDRPRFDDLTPGPPTMGERVGDRG